MKTTEPRAIRSKKSIVFLLVIAGILAVVFWGARFWLTRYTHPIIGLNATALEKVTLRNPQNDLIAEIDPQLWSSVIGYFKSSSPVMRPPDADCLAEVLFFGPDARQIRVEVLASGIDVGFFRVNGVTYRGGDERFFIRMMDDANRRRQRELNSPAQR